MRALLTGGRGMLGSSIAEQWLRARPDDELVVLTRDDVDLRDRTATMQAVRDIRPDLVIHAAAKVGGIMAKLAEPTTYLLDNLLIDTSVLSAALEARVPNLLYIGSAAIYPEHFRQPFLESDVLAAPLEPANEGYAIAKIAASKLCQYASEQFGLAYRVAVPSNLYGPNDDFSLSNGHLVAAALAKVDAAHTSGEPTVHVWGDGTARREFTYVDDLSEWLVEQAGSLMDWPPLVNLGVGYDRSVAEYYEAARSVVGYRGEFRYDASKPAGMQQRMLDSSIAIGLGWKPATTLEQGMAAIYTRYSTSSTRGK